MGSRTDDYDTRSELATQTEEQVPDNATLASVADATADVEISEYFAGGVRWQWWLAAVLAVPAIPIVVVAMLLVRLTSRGPAFYSQTRVGLHGRCFRLYKVRTMRQDAEAGTGAIWTTSLRDPRITPVGRVLRWTHIDELPQLWNVLRGEMALVGPRPERPEFTGLLARTIPGYLDRLSVLPGVTGLAQVNLPADSDVEDVRRKLALDLQYIREGSMSLDLRLILCTAARVVGLRFAWFRRFLDVTRRIEPSPQPSVSGCSTPSAPNQVGTSFSACDFDDNLNEFTGTSREVTRGYCRLAEPSTTGNHSSH